MSEEFVIIEEEPIQVIVKNNDAEYLFRDDQQQANMTYLPTSKLPPSSTTINNTNTNSSKLPITTNSSTTISSNLQPTNIATNKGNNLPPTNVSKLSPSSNNNNVDYKKELEALQKENKLLKNSLDNVTQSYLKLRRTCSRKNDPDYLLVREIIAGDWYYKSILETENYYKDIISDLNEKNKELIMLNDYNLRKWKKMTNVLFQ